MFLLDEHASAPIDPATSAPVTQCQLRLEHLINSLAKGRAKIIIPTPALAEVLVKAEAAGPQWLQIFRRSSHFRIAAFDERAAVEHAARQRGRTSFPSGRAPVSRPKAKFDDQIIAIAAVEQAEIIYSDDPDIVRRVPDGVRVIGIAELPLPPEGLQPDLPFAAPEPDADGGPDLQDDERQDG